jgi:hypothetical protein
LKPLALHSLRREPLNSCPSWQAGWQGSGPQLANPVLQFETGRLLLRDFPTRSKPERGSPCEIANIWFRGISPSEHE